jgi:hypothetical protein
MGTHFDIHSHTHSYADGHCNSKRNIDTDANSYSNANTNETYALSAPSTDASASPDTAMNRVTTPYRGLSLSR